MTAQQNIELDEDADRTVDEMLDWLCWDVADTAARFYPPQESTQECVDAMDVERDSMAGEYEYGTHMRALQDAVAIFDDLQRFGFDPKGRAQREVARNDLPEIDWEWYDVLVGHERGVGIK
jgi:hypothetical protein